MAKNEINQIKEIFYGDHQISITGDYVYSSNINPLLWLSPKDKEGLPFSAALKEDPSLSGDSQLHVTPTPRGSDISGLYSQNSYIHTRIQTNTHN